MIPYQMLPWFVVFQVLGVMLFASVFMAIGASVNQLKEAQSMLWPVWIMMMLPFFIWFRIIQEPNSPIAVALSFFPPSTPTMMVLRMATGAAVPLWQPLLGIVLTLLTTLACVYIAARIFRIGLLWQGKTPKLRELLRWAFSG